MNNSDHPAFPRQVPDGDEIPKGLTKREYFACRAMQGICANVNAPHWDANTIVVESVRYADALLLELQKQPTQ